MRHWNYDGTNKFIKMYPIEGYRYADQLVPAMLDRWPDPDTGFTVNESSFYRNEMERNNCKINETIYKTNDFNETKAKHNNNIAYNLSTMSNYVFIPYFGGLQSNSTTTSSIVWHHMSDANHHIGSYLSSDATPFIPAKSGSSECFHFFCLSLLFKHTIETFQTHFGLQILSFNYINEQSQKFTFYQCNVRSNMTMQSI